MWKGAEWNQANLRESFFICKVPREYKKGFLFFFKLMWSQFPLMSDVIWSLHLIIIMSKLCCEVFPPWADIWIRKLSLLQLLLLKRHKNHLNIIYLPFDILLHSLIVIFFKFTHPKAALSLSDSQWHLSFCFCMVFVN